MKKKYVKQIAGFSMFAILLVVNFGFNCLGKSRFGASTAVSFGNLGKSSALASQRSEGVPTITTAPQAEQISHTLYIAVAEGHPAPMAVISSYVSLSKLD